jgi:hypothetical protein
VRWVSRGNRSPAAGVQVNVGEPSTVPAQAAGRILGVAPAGEHERRRIATLVHWGYGTGWGAARGLIAGGDGGASPPVRAMAFQR